MAIHHLDESTFEYLKPTDQQIDAMRVIRLAAKVYADALVRYLPPGEDKDHCLRQHRQTAMWANVAITRFEDGTPRK